MTVSPVFQDLTVLENATTIEALASIDKNALGIVFVVDNENHLVGVLTDGDVRRGLIKGLSANELVAKFMNSNFVSLDITTPKSEILRHLNGQVRQIPLVDKSGRLVDFASFQKITQIPVMEPFLEGNELKYVVDCIQSKWISSQGVYVDRFEKTFSELFHGSPALTVSNGTTALHLAMMALGIGPGDEVILPNLTFAASINTVIHAGATPVIVDVDPNTWCISPSEIRAAISPKTKAIMPVHLYGQPCDMDEIMSIATKHNLLVIEDVAEALGSTFNGKLAGSFGDAACFSFYGNKMITTGEGGMIVFKDNAVFKRAKMLRDHGMRPERRYWHEEVGFNYRMTNLQAAVGLAQMEKFGEICDRKDFLNERYFENLKQCPYISLPPKILNTKSVHWLFTVRLTDGAGISRDQLMERLKLNNIDSRPAFYPLSDMPVYQPYVGNRNLEVSIEISKSALCLPSSVTLTSPLIDHISATLSGILDVRRYINSNSSDLMFGGATL